MKPYGKAFAAAAILFAGVAAFAPSPGASSEHFVIVNDNDITGTNYGTVLKLTGTKQNPLLPQVASLATYVPSAAGGPVPSVQVTAVGQDVCAFFAEAGFSGPNVVSSFKYPSLSLVGNYTDPQLPPTEGTAAIVVSGHYLVASYGAFPFYLATWQIGAGCTLTLLESYETPYQILNMAATPNGNALLVSDYGDSSVDSFAIGSGGTLTERGPYGVVNAEAAWGLDITADSKLAIFDMQGFGPPYDDNETEINTFVINADGSLRAQGNFGADGSLGDAHSGGWVRLSPGQKFLFVSSGTNVTTLNFTESPLNLSYSGCLTALRIPNGESTLNAGTMATVGTTGAGSGIYIAENFDFSTIALLSVNPTTGCTTETASSPFLLSDPNAGIWSLVSWPPRPF